MRFLATSRMVRRWGRRNGVGSVVRVGFAQYALDGVDEPVKIERLGEVVGEPRRLAQRALLWKIPGDRDGRHAVPLPYLPEQVPAVHAGHADVADEEIEMLRLAQVDGALR